MSPTIEAAPPLPDTTRHRSSICFVPPIFPCSSLFSIPCVLACHTPLPSKGHTQARQTFCQYVSSRISNELSLVGRSICDYSSKGLFSG